MHAASVFLCEGDARQTEIPSRLEGNLPAIDAEATEYLDGHRIYHGEAANRVEEQTERVWVTDDGHIVSERQLDYVPRRVDWFADVSGDPGFIGVSSASDGEWLVDRLGAQTGVVVRETGIDVTGFAEELRVEASADAWNVSKSQVFDADGEAEKTTIDYHDAADLEQATRGTVGLGFDYFWSDRHMRGIVYESGYVALYSDCLTEVFAEWFRQDILPYLYDAGDGETTQSALTEDEQDRADVAATDGGADDA